MTLVKATLQQLGPEPDKPKPIGKPIKVQFNPTTLRYQLSNNVDMGKSFGRSAAQYQGTSQGTVQFELIFDTADEDADGKPVDVRTKTKELEKFLLPDKKQPKSVPPRVEFSYGSFSVVGVMSALNQDFELFAESGVPLRAKLSVTIKEQKPEFEAGQVGAGANTGTAAKPFDHGKPTPGGAPAPSPADRTGTALAGESAADFASRMGLDPAAWKSFAAGLGDTLSLEAGARIDFSASASVGLGLGVQAGATAGVGGGRKNGHAAQTDRDVTAAEATGAGGITKAIEGRASARAAEAAADQRASFGLVTPAATPKPATTTTTAASPSAAVAARATEGVDPRAVSYGAGVPLRDRVGPPDQAPVALVAHTRCGKREQP